jgi:excisionase family DNA binding protein
MDIDSHEQKQEVFVEAYLNTKQLAEHLNMAEQSIRRWVMDNKIPYHRINGVIRYRLSEVELWIESKRNKKNRKKDIEVSNDLFNETKPVETTESKEDV